MSSSSLLGRANEYLSSDGKWIKRRGVVVTTGPGFPDEIWKPMEGDLRLNTNTDKVYKFNGSEWVIS